MDSQDLLKLLDLNSKPPTSPDDSTFGSLEPATPAPGGPTALHVDEWGLRRGRDLVAESERLRSFGTDELTASDFFTAAFDPDPTLMESCSDLRRHQFLTQLLDTPEYRALHALTRLDDTASSIAASHFAEQFARLKADEQIYEVRVDKKGRTWLSGNRGLIVQENGQWRRFTTEDGLENDSLVFMTLDADESVWLGSGRDAGVTRLRLEKLLQKEPGLDVTLTRRTDVYIPLEERTAIANRQSADLFLSIHANASRAPGVRGIETFFASPEASDEAAEELARAENAAFGPAAAKLAQGDPVLAILGDLMAQQQLADSQDFARLAQREITRVAPARSRGVKQAPFVVLMGVRMPAVLVEVGFITNPQDERALRKPAERERIAAGLARAIAGFRVRQDERAGVAQARDRGTR
jgi:N-acetylmuramoyl-L-alanine amidase